jgi:hypothetical protein
MSNGYTAAKGGAVSLTLEMAQQMDLDATKLSFST